MIFFSFTLLYQKINFAFEQQPKKPAAAHLLYKQKLLSHLKNRCIILKGKADQRGEREIYSILERNSIVRLSREFQMKYSPSALMLNYIADFFYLVFGFHIIFWRLITCSLKYETRSKYCSFSYFSFKIALESLSNIVNKK